MTKDERRRYKNNAQEHEAYAEEKLEKSRKSTNVAIVLGIIGMLIGGATIGANIDGIIAGTMAARVAQILPYAKILASVLLMSGLNVSLSAKKTHDEAKKEQALAKNINSILTNGLSADASYNSERIKRQDAYEEKLDSVETDSKIANFGLAISSIAPVVLTILTAIIGLGIEAEIAKWASYIAALLLYKGASNLSEEKEELSTKISALETGRNIASIEKRKAVESLVDEKTKNSASPLAETAEEKRRRELVEEAVERMSETKSGESPAKKYIRR